MLDDTWFDVVDRRTRQRSRAFHVLGAYGYPAGVSRGRAGRNPQSLDRRSGRAGDRPVGMTVNEIGPDDPDNAPLDSSVHLGIQFSKSDAPTARGSGLEVHHTVDAEPCQPDLD